MEEKQREETPVKEECESPIENMSQNNCAEASSTTADVQAVESQQTTEESTNMASPTCSTKESQDTPMSTVKSSNTVAGNPVGGRCLWVTNILPSTSACELKRVFSKCGRVLSARIVQRSQCSTVATPRCYGYITMASKSEADACVTRLNNTQMAGRVIRVIKAKRELRSIKARALKNIALNKLKKKLNVKKVDVKEKRATETTKPTNKKDSRKRNVEVKRSRSSSNVDRKSRSPNRSRRSDTRRSSASKSNKSRDLSRHNRDDSSSKRGRYCASSCRSEANDRSRVQRLLRQQRIEAERIERAREAVRRERLAIQRQQAALAKLEREKRMQLEREQREREQRDREQREREQRDREQRERDRLKREREKRELEKREREKRERENFERERREREQREKNKELQRRDKERQSREHRSRERRSRDLERQRHQVVRVSSTTKSPATMQLANHQRFGGMYASTPIDSRYSAPGVVDRNRRTPLLPGTSRNSASLPNTRYRSLDYHSEQTPKMSHNGPSRSRDGSSAYRGPKPDQHSGRNPEYNLNVDYRAEPPTELDQHSNARHREGPSPYRGSSQRDKSGPSSARNNNDYKYGDRNNATKSRCSPLTHPAVHELSAGQYGHSSLLRTPNRAVKDNWFVKEQHWQSSPILKVPDNPHCTPGAMWISGVSEGLADSSRIYPPGDSGYLRHTPYLQPGWGPMPEAPPPPAYHSNTANNGTPGSRYPARKY